MLQECPQGPVTPSMYQDPPMLSRVSIHDISVCLTSITSLGISASLIIYRTNTHKLAMVINQGSKEHLEKDSMIV